MRQTVKTTRDSVPSRTKANKEIEVDAKRCRHCGICIEFCSRGVLDKSKDEWLNV